MKKNKLLPINCYQEYENEFSKLYLKKKKK
jgi:hypothetical protein